MKRIGFLSFGHWADVPGSRVRSARDSLLQAIELAVAVEEGAAVDLISGGRLQLGVSRGSPESVVAGYEAFGHLPARGESDADMARRHTARFRSAFSGAGMASASPQAGGPGGPVPIQPLSPTLPERIWWGAGNRASARWAGRQGMNLMSSTLLTEDTGVPFDRLQAEQIAGYREAWTAAGTLPGCPYPAASFR